jgi:hypothetical protein
MALKLEKWTSKTYLMLINFGLGTFHVHCTTLVGGEKVGKIFIMVDG